MEILTKKPTLPNAGQYESALFDERATEASNQDGQEVELYRVGRLQRSPKTIRNIQLFVNNFENANVKDDFEHDSACNFESKFPKLNKHFEASSFSIDSWSIDSTSTEEFNGHRDARKIVNWVPKSYKKTIVISSTILVCTIVVSTVLGLGFFKPTIHPQLPRIGK